MLPKSSPPNRYVPVVDCNGNIDWEKPYIKNEEIKRMPVPYEKRKDYYKRYRETHKEKFREYARNFLRRKKLAIIRSMIRERVE